MPPKDTIGLDYSRREKSRMMLMEEVSMHCPTSRIHVEVYCPTWQRNMARIRYGRH
jgi:hypothetical protein